MSEYILTHKHHTHPHAASGWRIHCGVEVTELSTNKQHSLSQSNRNRVHMDNCGVEVTELSGDDVVDWYLIQ